MNNPLYQTQLPIADFNNKQALFLSNKKTYKDFFLTDDLLFDSDKRGYIIYQVLITVCTNREQITESFLRTEALAINARFKRYKKDPTSNLRTSETEANPLSKEKLEKTITKVYKLYIGDLINPKGKKYTFYNHSFSKNISTKEKNAYSTFKKEKHGKEKTIKLLKSFYEMIIKPADLKKVTIKYYYDKFKLICENKKEVYPYGYEAIKKYWKYISDKEEYKKELHYLDEIEVLSNKVIYRNVEMIREFWDSYNDDKKGLGNKELLKLYISKNDLSKEEKKYFQNFKSLGLVSSEKIINNSIPAIEEKPIIKEAEKIILPITQEEIYDIEIEDYSQYNDDEDLQEETISRNTDDDFSFLLNDVTEEKDYKKSVLEIKQVVKPVKEKIIYQDNGYDITKIKVEINNKIKPTIKEIPMKKEELIPIETFDFLDEPILITEEKLKSDFEIYEEKKIKEKEELDKKEKERNERSKKTLEEYYIKIGLRK